MHKHLGIFLAVLGLCGSVAYADLPIVNPLFLKVSGSNIFRDDGQKMVLRGFNLSNYAHGNWKDGINIRPQTIPEWVLTPDDIEQLKNLGVNVVRYELNYDVLEPQNITRNFKIIEKHLRWLSEAQIYVILNLHITKGRSSAFLSKGLTIFEDPELWKDFEDSWVRIVTHFKDFSSIAAFEFFNEPKIPTKGKEFFWSTVENLVEKMRAIDQNHIFIIPNPEGATNPDGTENWDFQPLKKLNDPNIWYTFHYYEPKDFTHQKFWQSIPANGMKYPFLKFHNAQYVPNSIPMLYKEETRPAAKNGWKWTRSKVFKAPASATYGTFAFVVGNDRGSVYFDNFKLIEIAPSGKKTEITLPNQSFRPYDWNYVNRGEYDPDQYYGLQYYVEGKPDSQVKFLQPESAAVSGDTVISIVYPGYDDKTALKISNASSAVTSISFDQRVFPIFPKKGYQYQIEALIKTENSQAADPAKGRFNNIDITWFKADKEIVNKAWMKKDMVEKYGKWAKQNRVPLFCGEFGTSNFIKNEYRQAWTSDIADVLNELGVHWAYWDFKGIYGWGYSFSLYAQQTDNPEKPLFVNTELLKALKPRITAK